MRMTASSIFVLIGVVLDFTTVSADMCQDLCFRELGRAGCSKGSWCKTNNNCQSLFWTSALKTGVCFFDGSSGCTDVYPVFCNEAEARLGHVIETTTTVSPVVATTPDSGPSELSLHCSHQGGDPRPRVKTSFQAHEQDIGFSLLFDTGSDVTHIVRALGTPEVDAPPSYIAEDAEPVSRAAKWGKDILISA